MLVTLPEDDPPAAPVANQEPLPAELLIPHPRRLSPATRQYRTILALHEAAIGRGESTYRDPLSGLSALTAQHLWERGYCCDSMCRHCPWVERDDNDGTARPG